MTLGAASNTQFSNFCSSDAEADIPVVGNVFSFVFTKYPPDWRWRFLKVYNFNFTVFFCCLVF